MIALFTGLLLVIGASVKITHSVVIPRFKKLSFFQFKKIVMNETPHITQTELQSSLNVPFGKNIFDLDLADIKKQLKKHPWLLDANITRIFPDRVNIEVFEKKPVAILSLGGLFFLDEDGRRIARIGSADDVDFPVLSGFSESQVEEIKPVLTAFDIIRLYKKNEFLQTWPLSEVHWQNQNGFAIFTKNPTFEIRLGQTGFSKKISRLERVLKDLFQKNQLPYLVDLNFSKKVVVKLSK